MKPKKVLQNIEKQNAFFERCGSTLAILYRQTRGKVKIATTRSYISWGTGMGAIKRESEREREGGGGGGWRWLINFLLRKG